MSCARRLHRQPNHPERTGDTASAFAHRQHQQWVTALCLFVGCSHVLENGDNGLMCEANQSCVLGEQAAAQIMQARRQFVHDAVLRQTQVDFQLMDGFYNGSIDMHWNTVITGVHRVLVGLYIQS